MSYFEKTKVANASGVAIDPATETTLANINSKLPVLDAGGIPVIAKNITTKFREAFETYLPGTNWAEVKASGDIIAVDGNAASASYLVISKNPLVAGNESSITSTDSFGLPIELSVGLSMSQRTLGQEFSVELIDTATPLADVADIEIESISQTTTTLTVNTVADHGLVVGKSIGIYGCSDTRANYTALVVASCPSPRQFTVTAGPGGTIASITINNPAGAKGFVYFRERLGRAKNGISQIFEQPTVTQSSLYIRSESGDVLPSGVIAGSHSVTVGTTLSVALVNSPYQYAFSSTSEYRIFAQADRIQWADSSVDVLGQTTSRLLRTQICPNSSANYKLRIRTTNNKSLTVPNAQIVSAVKTGTTMATITTDVNHGLIANDPVVIYGIANQAASAFPNLAVATVVDSVVNDTTFTIIIGTASTVTSYGGFVAKVQGGNLGSALGFNAVTLASSTLTTLSDGTRQLLATGSASWAGLSIGDGVNLVGVRNINDGESLGVDGAWKVANVSAANLFLVPMPGNTPIADFTVINCGGGVIKRTEMRLSFIRLFDYERQRVEMLARPTGDLSSAVPVVSQGGSVVVSGALTGVTTVASANLGIPATVADVASAALTTTTTVAAITPSAGIAYSVVVPVTVVTGTLPTLDLSIEESDDSGTNWYKVYDFPRITAVGIYRSPAIPLIGNRVRYVQTVGGTLPSFTRSINRLQSNYPALAIRQLIDRSIVLSTLNSVTQVLTTQNFGNRVQLLVNVGAITTTAPQLQIEGSDDRGISWYAVGAPLTAVASSTVQLSVNDVNAAQMRVRVSTAGVGVTAGSVTLKVHD